MWKAPAGTAANIEDAALEISITAAELEQLAADGVNSFRELPAVGLVSWGARTLVGTDMLNTEWKYVNLRRLALYIEESLYWGLRWVVFEPNDEPLWSQIQFHVETFMMDLFRNGAFQGSTPSEAFFIKCDNTTTTQADIQNSIVNLLVGFAPLKPAEFVILRFKLPGKKL